MNNKPLFLFIIITLSICACKNRKLTKDITINKIEAPAGTIKIADNLFIDDSEISNLSYREFMYWNERIYEKNSSEYLKLLPKNNVWSNLDSGYSQFDSFYLRHPAYQDFPVVGISYEQATLYNTTSKRDQLIAIYAPFKNNLDGGNTTGLISDIENANTSTVNGIQSNLISLSPYLSIPVLEKVASSPVFTDNNVKDIIEANPHGARSLWVLNSVQNRTPVMPQSLLDDIYAQDTVFTPKDSIDWELGKVQAEYDQLLSKLLYQLKKGPNYHYTDIETWLKHPTNPYSYMRLAELYFENNKWDQFNSTIDTMKGNFNETEYDTSELATFINLYSTLQTWKENNEYSIYGDITKRDWLLSFASTHLNYPSKVNTLLSLFDTSIINDNVFINTPLSQPNTFDLTSITYEDATSNHLSVYPNPAKNIINLISDLERRDYTVKMYDLNGKLLYQNHWNSKEGLTINTERLKTGTYIIEVISGKEKMYSKVQIIK